MILLLYEGDYAGDYADGATTQQMQQQQQLHHQQQQQQQQQQSYFVGLLLEILSLRLNVEDTDDLNINSINIDIKNIQNDLNQSKLLILLGDNDSANPIQNQHQQQEREQSRTE